MQLERDIEEYARQSDKVAMWDNQLRENQKLLNSLMDSVHRILVDQEDLDGSIQAIEVRLAQNAVIISDIDTVFFLTGISKRA